MCLPAYLDKLNIWIKFCLLTLTLLFNSEMKLLIIVTMELCADLKSACDIHGGMIRHTMRGDKPARFYFIFFLRAHNFLDTTFFVVFVLLFVCLFFADTRFRLRLGVGALTSRGTSHTRNRLTLFPLGARRARTGPRGSSLSEMYAVFL